MKKLNQYQLLALFALALPAASAGADPMAYVVNLYQQFGTVNLASGAFNPIGPGTPEGEVGLVAGPGGSLLTLSVSGNLDAIDPSTGLTTVIGATGLGGNVNALAKVGGTLYATDLDNNLYSLHPTTGVATLIGPTGMPATPAYPFTTNPDGSLNLMDESLYSKGGKLYATFDAFTLGADGFTTSFTVNPQLYAIDPATGLATLISSAAPNILSSVEVGGVAYAFQGAFSAASPFSPTVWSSTLDLTNGQTVFLSNVDSSPIFGALAIPAVPEPSSVALFGIGLFALAAGSRKRQGPDPQP